MNRLEEEWIDERAKAWEEAGKAWDELVTTVIESLRIPQFVDWLEKKLNR